jgi:hypothetical protein
MAIMEQVLQKKGEELFKELRRQYSEADPEDYFKAGRWSDDKMRLDLGLFVAHRSEGGAPDAPDLKDVKLPAEMPVESAAPMGYSGLLSQKVALAAVAGAKAGVPLVRPLGPAGAGAANGGVESAVTELKNIALFVAKWKLNAQKAKTALASLTQIKRKYVMENFKGAEGDKDVSEALEEFIKECADTKAWGDTPVAPAMAAVTGTTVRPGVAPRQAVTGIAAAKPGPFAGLKRPLMPNVVGVEPPKRPNLMAGAGGVAPKITIRPQGVNLGKGAWGGKGAW